jgi:hypothetical protein
MATMLVNAVTSALATGSPSIATSPFRKGGFFAQEGGGHKIWGVLTTRPCNASTASLPENRDIRVSGEMC